jgi:hypothetical protein
MAWRFVEYLSFETAAVIGLNEELRQHYSA